MLGTFSFEPLFRSYFCFTIGPLNFSEIANRSSSHLPPLSLSAFLCRRRRAPPPPLRRAAGHLLLAVAFHASRPRSSPLTPPRAGLPPLLPRNPEAFAATTSPSPSPSSAPGPNPSPPGIAMCPRNALPSLVTYKRGRTPCARVHSHHRPPLTLASSSSPWHRRCTTPLPV